jgi:hypothetical protein
MGPLIGVATTQPPRLMGRERDEAAGAQDGGDDYRDVLIEEDLDEETARRS